MHDVPAGYVDRGELPGLVALVGDRRVDNNSVRMRKTLHSRAGETSFLRKTYLVKGCCRQGAIADQNLN
jgi:hypothetical protein